MNRDHSPKRCSKRGTVSVLVTPVFSKDRTEMITMKGEFDEKQIEESLAHMMKPDSFEVDLKFNFTCCKKSEITRKITIPVRNKEEAFNRQRRDLAKQQATKDKMKTEEEDCAKEQYIISANSIEIEGKEAIKKIQEEMEVKRRQLEETLAQKKSEIDYKFAKVTSCLDGHLQFLDAFQSRLL